MEERRIIKSKVLRVDDHEFTIRDVNMYTDLGYIVVKMEKMNDCLWFHLAKYEDMRDDDDD